MTHRRFWRLAALQAGSLALAAWVGSGESLWMLVAGPAAVTALALSRGGDLRATLACACLIWGVTTAFIGHWSLERLASGWGERSLRAESEIQSRLADALDGLLANGEATVAELAARADRDPTAGGGRLVEGIRRPGVDALAVFGPSGELQAWDGSHQGPIPEEVRSGLARYLYREGALFGYLYVTQPLGPGRGTAVSASLLRSELPPPLNPPADDFRSRFEESTGARIDISRADRALGESVFDLRWEDRVLMSVTLLPASEAEARGARELAWMRVVTALLLLAWLLAVLAHRGEPAAALGGGALMVLLVVVPFGRLTGWSGLFSPADFLLPGPLALTIGDVLAVGLGGALVLGLLPTERLPRIPPFLAAFAGTGLVAGLLVLCEIAASRDFLASGEIGWVVLQGAIVALSLLILGGIGHLGAGEREMERPARPWLLAGSLVVAITLSISWAALAGRPLPVGAGAIVLLWTLPVWGIVRASSRGPGWPRNLLPFLVLAMVSASAVLPWAWNMRVQSRMQVAEERVERLGTRPDPFLEFLLGRVGERARVLSSEGRDPVEVLYGAWTGSGLATEGVPLWITYWSPDAVAQEELQIGLSGPRPPLRDDLLEEARTGDGVVVRRFDLADTHYVGVAALPRGSFVSVILPPRRILTGSSPLGPLFSPARGQPDPLVLIPLLPGEVPGETEGISWMRTEEGWQGETYLAYPDDVYHAHYLVELPGWILLLARATLLLLLNVGVLGILWVVGRWVREEGPSLSGGWMLALSSFRGRVTLALFGFFLVPSVLFGTLAYRTLAAAALRTADTLATRAAEDAASWYVEVGGAMDALANRVGSDLLLYENGELVGGSYPELLELGLYEGWLPPEIHAEMLTGEALMTTAAASLGGWEYVVAYRRIPGGWTLAAPAPLQAGATALRQRDVADLLGFSVVMGAMLSTLLALLVGRALARPIQTLRVGSERVGAGNMAVRLPEGRQDEFGAVFDAFNRMVDRLDRARRALLRSSRRTRAIVEEVATGVVALDSRGRVRLANPRAEELIGTALTLHRPLPEGASPGDGRDALVSWVRSCVQEGAPEASSEVSFGERRIRVRARRISRRGPPGGIVLTLEDVTDELRTERILAWGEVAQQVAHEVKNPLTPIKLGVQHILRAWEDERPDYDEILRRNVDAVLEEIDRLAGIANSFSRFGAPTASTTGPLEAVPVAEVVGEVLDLYRAGEGPVEFDFVGEEGLPPVRARRGELKEVLVNLLENARTALPEGGTVSVEAFGANGKVDLRVRDDGSGIPPDLLPRVFEPHFSTRSGGTGLGLAIVRRLVESWGGTVRVESGPGTGTVVHIGLWRWRDERIDPRERPARGGVVPADS